MITVIKILLVIATISLIFHMICNLLAMFWNTATKELVGQILLDPTKHVRFEEASNFFRNVIYLMIVLWLLTAAFNGSIKISKEKDSEITIEVVRNKGD